MFRKLTAKVKKDKDSRKSVVGSPGAAVPYREPNGQHSDDHTRGMVGRNPSPTLPIHYRGSTVSEEPSRDLVFKLGEAAARADIETLRQLIKVDKIDINSRDKDGNTALHRAAAVGRCRTIKYLLLHGAEIEATNRKGENALYVAMDFNNTSTVGILLDYMHSVDNRPREPFVLLRAKKEKSTTYIPQKVKSCTELKPFKKRGADLVQLLVAHGQRADDMSIFLYSVLDVPVEHAFIMNSTGEMNMKNFQRFESKANSRSLTVLNTVLRVMDVTGYEHLKCLIVVSCGMVRLVLSGLPCLELLDVRYNKLDSLPEDIGKCSKLKTLKCAHNLMKRLPSHTGDLHETLTVVDCSYNMIKRLPSKIISCTNLVELECDHNGILELPIDLGVLTKLEVLHVHNNKLSQLPLSVAHLEKLQSISFHSNPLQNIPTDFPERVPEVQQYLSALQDDPVPNNTIKLVLVGQEGVGKTTLLKALKKTFWMIPTSPKTPKTDGIDIKDIQLDDVTLRCFDCGGDVDFNETHTFFITQGALYLACFNLAEYCMATVERGSFLLGRLQLWLQYIFSKVPNAQVVIVGTHADHPSLTRRVFEEIWEQLRGLLVKSREHHQQYFKGTDRLCDCLLCQSDSKCLRRVSVDSTGFVNMGFEDNMSVDSGATVDAKHEVIAFPHIVGYYEVSSVKAVGNTNPLKINSNTSIKHLKDAIKEIAGRLKRTNQELPRRWANVQESLQNHIHLNPDNALASLDEVARIAQGQGISDKPQLINMLQFFKAQGNVLYFPQLENLQNTVILDPEWLAKIFSAVISYRDTGFDAEGCIHRETLKEIWKEKELEGPMGDKVLTLLRHFGVCLPVSENNKELFPCKLPLGEPDEAIWPISPQRNEKQLTYRVTFPSIVPPPFFSNLLVTVYRSRARVNAKCKPAFYSNKIVDWLAADRIGCNDCGVHGTSSSKAPEVIYQVLFEIIPHSRALQITSRGQSPCCLLSKLKRVLNKVTDQFEGLGTIEMDTIVCSGCFMQGSKDPHKYSIKHMREDIKKKDKVVCRNAHIFSSAKNLLCGHVNDTCLPLATIRPKLARDKFDYSGCPKLFIMLPVNKDGLSFDKNLKLFTSSLMYDGYAAHFLCEFPDGYHVTKTPGYRLKSPKEFMHQFGPHALTVLQLLRHLSGSTVSPQYANQTHAVTNVIDSIIEDYEVKFPSCKTANNGPPAQTDPLLLHQQIIMRGAGIQRDHLRKHLNIMDRPDTFGPLRRLKYGDSLLWLCNEHYRQMRIITLGASGDANIQAYIESNA